jgi:AbrB family looped-hinge helix DNA binding protein
MPGVRATIDAAGRLGIPKEIRNEAGLRPGMELEVRLRDGVVEIEPAVGPIKLVKKGRFLIAVAADDGEPLTSEDVERIRGQIERERGPS